MEPLTALCPSSKSALQELVAALLLDEPETSKVVELTVAEVPPHAQVVDLQVVAQAAVVEMPSNTQVVAQVVVAHAASHAQVVGQLVVAQPALVAQAAVVEMPSNARLVAHVVVAQAALHALGKLVAQPAQMTAHAQPMTAYAQVVTQYETSHASVVGALSWQHCK